MNENTISYWNMTGEKTDYPQLCQSVSTDILIIGGGITGITCAYCLALQGIKPVLIEEETLAGGTTGNTTGKITLQHGVVLQNIMKKYGLETAKNYAVSQSRALDFVRDAVAREVIDCGLAQNTAYVYAVNEEEQDTLLQEYEIARQVGIEAVFLKHTDFPAGNRGLLGYKEQYVLHPVRYVEGLARAAVNKGAAIYCHTKAERLTDGDIKTVYLQNNITIQAKHVVMATQYPFYDGPNLFYTRLYPKRTYGIAVRAKREWADGSYISVGNPSRSIRTHVEDGERILIVVGDSHGTGRGDMSIHFDNLIQFADTVAGVQEVIAKWSAQDYDTPDEIPYIGRVSDNANIYAATGFRKWGLSNGTLSGMLIADLITMGNCQFEGLYSRTRSDITHSIAKTFVGTMFPIVELVKSKLEGSQEIENLQPGEGKVIRFGGDKAGIYLDYDGDATIIDITCTHVGTELNFNTAERTWDCPAHGGRFNTDGVLLEGPPKHSLKVFYKGSYQELLLGISHDIR